MPPSTNLVIGVSDAKASNDPAINLVTYSLGSCIGISLYDSAVRVGGMLHYQLPCSSADPQRASERPLMFADTGMEWLIAEMQKRGGSKRRLSVHLVGGAQMLDDAKIFDIGRRNHAAIRKILWKHGMFIAAEHVGGKSPRTMQLSIASGEVTVKMNNEIITL